MPSRVDQDWLLDILDEADLITTALADRSQADFQSDRVLQRAVLHMLQTIGEAAGQLTPQVTIGSRRPVAANPGDAEPDCA